MSRVVIEAVDIGNRGPFRIVGERIGEWVMAPTIHWFGEDREIRRLMSLWDVRIVGRPEVVWWGGGLFRDEKQAGADQGDGDGAGVFPESEL